STNDLNICVSNSTKRDIETYFPEIDRRRNLVAHPGCGWPDRFAALSEAWISQSRAVPYIVVLGTIEPRKNIDAVLSCLARQPSLTERFAFVFCGRHGWGPEVKEKLAEFRLLREAERGRLVFTGFIGEFAKYCILS